MALRITTWNVNSLRKRRDGLEALVRLVEPDIICLQETKVTDADFPSDWIKELGYPHIHAHGMPGYNGVAILSRHSLGRPAIRSWLSRDDRRHVSATIPLGEGIEIHSVYIPAGGDEPDPVKNPRFAHKLGFLEAFGKWSAGKRRGSAHVILTGDFNVAPLPTDVWSHEKLLNVVSHTPREVELLNRAFKAGRWVDAVRHVVPAEERLYTWWSYRAPDWAKADKGRRLDHVWVTPSLKPSIKWASALREARGWDTPSDHVPVTVVLDV